MDPMTTLVVSSAVGGAAGSFIKELSSNGVQWLFDLVTAQSPEMQAAAKKNMENFVTRLARRVERLESEIPADKAEIFKDSLNHPGSALLIKTAIVDSATTDNDDRHELLAELIAQRLTAHADDMIALAGAAACSVVISLSSRQIKMLSLLAVLQAIRPLQKHNINDLQKAKEYILGWWNNNLTPLMADGSIEDAQSLDYEHLAAMGCIRISMGSFELIKILSNSIVHPDPNLSEADFEGQVWYPILKKQWQWLGHSTATSVGQLIGILHRDAKSKIKTQINW